MFVLVGYSKLNYNLVNLEATLKRIDGAKDTNFSLLLMLYECTQNIYLPIYIFLSFFKNISVRYRKRYHNMFIQLRKWRGGGGISVSGCCDMSHSQSFNFGFDCRLIGRLQDSKKTGKRDVYASAPIIVLFVG